MKGGIKLNKRISPVLGAGLVIFVVYQIIQRFVIKLSDWIAIPVLVVASILIIIGGLKEKN